MTLCSVFLCVRVSYRAVNSVVYLSNVTLWVPAAEFSFIRSHTAEQPTSFTINLQGKGPHLASCCGIAQPSMCMPTPCPGGLARLAHSWHVCDRRGRVVSLRRAKAVCRLLHRAIA